MGNYSIVIVTITSFLALFVTVIWKHYVAAQLQFEGHAGAKIL